MSGQGDNSVNKDQLRSIIERVERLNEEKKTITDDIGDVYKEASGNGYDSKTLRRLVALRKLSAEDREAQAQILETYQHALGMV